MSPVQGRLAHRQNAADIAVAQLLAALPGDKPPLAVGSDLGYQRAGVELGPSREPVSRRLGARQMLRVLFVVAHQQRFDLDLAGRLVVDFAVRGYPLGERELGFIKILSAKRCALCLSGARVEPGPAPGRAIGSPAEPISGDLAGPAL